MALRLLFPSLARAVGATLILTWLTPVATFSQSISFLPRQNYSTNADPRSVTSGDFNGDGRLDLVVANTTGNTLSLFRGNGDGTFQTGVTIPAAINPYYVVATDFNGDRVLDLAVAHVSSGELSVYLGSGDGTFAAPRISSVQGNPFSLASGDLNGDGIVDLVVANYTGRNNGSGNVEVRLGNGDGTFLAAGTWGPGPSPSPLFAAIADFDRDGKADVAATMANNDVRILPGNGDGTLRFGPLLPGAGSHGIVAGDFNSDGFVDIAATGFGSSANRVAVTLGNGDGTFQPPRGFAVNGFPWGVAKGDLNADNILDLVATNTHSNDASVLVGNGDGTFQEQVSIPLGISPYFAALADINNDGMPDLAIANSGDDTLSILMNNLRPPGSIWKTPVNALAGQNSLRKFGACGGCYDAGAATVFVVESGDAFAEFTFAETSGLRTVGLTQTSSISDPRTIDFGLRIQSGFAEVLENGVYRTDVPAEPGAIFRIGVQGGVVMYAKNGSVFYTSSVPPTYPLTFVAALASAGTEVTGVTFTAAAGEPAAHTFTAPDRGGISLTTAGGTGPTNFGYARIQPNSGQNTPSGLAIFGSRQNNVLVTEAGVPASALIQSGRIYAEVNGPINTGLAIVNPHNQSATLTFYFTNSSGVNFGNGTATIPAFGKITGFLNENPFNGGSSVNGTFTFDSSMPVSAVALLGFTNERSEFLITTLHVADLAAPAVSGTVIFPDFADGGGWTTQIVLVNPGDTRLTGTVQFLNQSGAAADVTVNGQTNSSFEYSIPARTSLKFPTSGAPASPVSGSVRVVSSGSSAAPSGLAIFSLRNGPVTVTEASVLAQPPGNAFRIYAEASGTLGQVGSIQTGLAVTNTSGSPATVSLELTRLDGTSTGLTGSLELSANGQTATFLNQIQGLASLPAPFQGVLRISSSAQISVVGLRGRYNERGDFLITTTPPVNEASAPSSEPLYLPHIVDSGGYTTQFILLSGQPGQSSSGTLQLFSPTGGALNWTIR